MHNLAKSENFETTIQNCFFCDNKYDFHINQKNQMKLPLYSTKPQVVWDPKLRWADVIGGTQSFERHAIHTGGNKAVWFEKKISIPMCRRCYSEYNRLKVIDIIKRVLLAGGLISLVFIFFEIVNKEFFFVILAGIIAWIGLIVMEDSLKQKYELKVISPTSAISKISV